MLIFVKFVNSALLEFMSNVIPIIRSNINLEMEVEDSNITEVIENDTPEIELDFLLTGIKGENGLKDLELLHRRFYNILCNYALRFVSYKEEAQDVVSDVFFRLWRDRENLEFKISSRAYLFTAVRNGAYNYLGREHKNHEPLDSPSDYISSSENNPEQSMVYTELKTDLESAISQLPPRCRKVFLLSRNEGLKYKEIALELGITPKAVEANMCRALKSLRHSLGHYLYFLVFFALSHF